MRLRIRRRNEKKILEILAIASLVTSLITHIEIRYAPYLYGVYIFLDKSKLKL